MSDALFAEVAGSGGPVIVLLHGFGSTHRTWRAVQPELAAHATTLAFDLPGHGASLAFAGGRSPRSAAEAVVASLDAREGGAGKVHLVGHSMGGAIATLIALAAPQLVASLTLLAPGGFGPEINHRLLARYAAARRREELQAVLEAMSGWNHPVSDAVLDDYVAMRAVPGQVEQLETLAANMVRDGRQGVIGGLAGLRMPVSLAWGNQDCVLPARQSEGLPADFAIHRLEETGHMLPAERPEEVLRMIRRNIGSHGL